MDAPLGTEWGENVFFFSLARHALLQGLKLAGVGSGDSVMMPEFICRELLASVHLAGAQPVFYPVDEQLKPVSLPTGKNIKAVVAVDYFGFPQDVAPFRKFCDSQGAVLIEDNAHGFLSRDPGGQLLGLRGDMGILSIRKTFPLPDGGALVVNPPSQAGAGMPVSNGSELRGVLDAAHSGQDALLTRTPRAASASQACPGLLDAAPLGLKLEPCMSAPEFRDDPLPLGYRIKSVFRKVQKTTGIPLKTISESTVRAARQFRTGSPFPKAAPDCEHVIPALPPMHRESFRRLCGQDLPREGERRKRLYFAVEKRLEGLDIRPVFGSLPAGVVPYGYPFRADDRTAGLVASRAGKMGFDCAFWPELPAAVVPTAPPHYKNVYWVNFLS